MSDVTREARWMCIGCGYVMDSCSPVQGAGSPDDGDMMLCLNCGALHIRHGARWLPITPAEEATLDSEQRAFFARCETARRRAVDTDLSRKQHGGRA